MSSPRPRIAVVGAGVVGLSTAVQIQSALPSAQVTIVADKFNQATTSDGAAGLFRPMRDIFPGIKRELLRRWMKDSFEFYNKIALSPEAPEAGISQLTVYHFQFTDRVEKEEAYAGLVYDCRPCTDAEMEMFSNTSKADYAVRYTTVITEGRWLLPWHMKRFKANGGLVEEKKLKSLEELVGHFDVVVNCTGLGSCDLLGDEKLIPSRGQVIRVKAPWVKHALLIDDDIYMIPGKETVIVGGTRQQGDSHAGVRPSDRDHIWEQACKYMPYLKSAKWEWEWVGHRPTRDPLRLEKETIEYRSGSLQVVHNYGHGGEGVALSWGTGKHACRLVCEIVSSTDPNLVAAKP